jgi:hypothetical protein
MLCGSLSPQHGASSGSDEREGLEIWKVVAKILNMRSRTTKGWSSRWGLDEELNKYSP